MPSLTEDLRRLEQYRGANPSFEKLSDSQLTELINKETGELPTLRKSSAIGRTVARGSNMLSDVGQALEEGIVGKPQLSNLVTGEKPSKVRRVVGRAANMITQSLPEIGANMLAARVLPQSKTGAGLIAAGNIGAAVARTKVETGDTQAAVGSGVGAGVSMLGSMIGARKGRTLATKGGLSPALGGAAGGYVGSMPGDAVEIGMSPGGFSEFVKDPVNLPAYLLSQAPFAAVDYMSERGNAAKANREKTVAETPTLDEFMKPKAEEQLVQLKKKPVATLTEQEIQQMDKLTQELRSADEKKLRKQEVQGAQDIKQKYSGISYESPATLREQLLMVNKGKKPMAFAELGSTVPRMEVWEQGYVEHTRPEGTYFYNPDIVTPKAIDDAVASDTVGQLLGYGTPRKPQNPNGLSYTLRDRKGMEKLSVELSNDTMTSVGEALKKLKEPNDRLVIEATEKTLARRKADEKLIKDYSVRYEPDPYEGKNPDWQYIGQQPGWKHIPATELWNYVGKQDHPEFVRGSTYSRNSLEKAGIPLPPLATRSVGVDEATTTKKDKADYSVQLDPREARLSSLLGSSKIFKNYASWAKDGIPRIRVQREDSTLPGAVTIITDHKGERTSLMGSMPDTDTFSVSGLGDAEGVGLKAAVKHALEQGATVLTVPKELVKLARKITQDEGVNSKRPDGVWNFKLTNLSPDVETMFSIYGLADQQDYEASLRNAENQLEAALLSGQDVTPEQFVNAIFQGQKVDKSIAIRYVKDAVGSEHGLRTFEMQKQGRVDIAGVTQGLAAAVNVAKDPVKAFRTALHELSHVATNELKYSNPAAYNDNLSWYNDLTTEEGRINMFEQMAKASGLTEYDAAYSAGAKFDKQDPNYRERVMKEGVAFLTEVLAHEAYKADARINPTIAKWLSFLPVGVQSALTRVGLKVQSFFGEQYPSLRHMLPEADKKALTAAYDKLIKFTRSNATAQAEAYKILRRMELIDEGTLLDRVANRADQSDWKAARQTFGGFESEELRDYSMSWLTDSRLATKAKDVYEDYFFSPLFRTKLKPFTLDAFREGHHFRDKIKSILNSYSEFLGQNSDKTLSREQALSEEQKWIDKTVSSPLLNDRFNKVLVENLNRRQKAIETGKTTTGDDLVSTEEMISKYGLKPDEAAHLSKLIETPRLVAEQTLRFQTATDTVNLAKLFYVQNRQQDIKQVKAKSAELTRIADLAGSAQFQHDFYMEALKRYSTDPNGNRAEIEQIQGTLVGLKQQIMQQRMVFDQAVRQMFGMDFEMPGLPGEDFFINTVADFAFARATNRAEQQFITKDEGYFPLVRRGRYMLRVYNQGPEGEIIKTTKEYKGFKKLSELKAYMKEKKLDETNSEVVDKEAIQDRVALYTPKAVQGLREKARKELQVTIDRLLKSRDFANDTIKTAVITNLQDVMNSYRPLEQELADVVSVKGDKFRERRWLVPGYEENDFIPNIYEYMDYKTVAGQKTVTRAEMELQHLRPEVQADPKLLTRMQTEMEYVLGRTSEWSNARKFIFYSYLGASIKNALQNFLQLPLNAIPEAFAKGAGMHAYTDMLKAGALSVRWLKDGTTGNKTFDVLLKQAETDGSVIPNLVEAYAPSSYDVQGALDSINRQKNGFSWIGQKVDRSKTQFMQGVDRFMRSTSVASEGVNRRISFLMSLLDSQRKQVKDPRAMYNSAKDFTDYANFIGDKANRPGFQVKSGNHWIHGPLLAATAMQSFVFNHVSQLYAYTKQAFKGDRNAQKAAIAAYGHLLLFSGVLGMVGASTIEQLLEEATGFSFKNALRKKVIEGSTEMFDISEEAGGRLADAITTGLPTALGIDAGGSIGLGDPLLQYRAGEDITALDLTGPGGSLVQRYADTVKSAAAGDWGTAARKVPLKAWNHIVKVYDAVSDGDYKTQQGMPLVQNLDGSASIATALGFTPRQVSIQRDLQQLRRKNALKSSDEYREATTQIARLLSEFEQTGDQSKLIQANDLFKEYNDSTGGTQDRSSMVQSVAQVQERFRQPTTEAPSMKEQASFDQSRKVFPEAKVHYAEQLPALFDELKTAQLLGQTDVLAKRLGSLDVAVQRRALYDSLIAAGFDPAQASALASENSENLIRSQKKPLPGANGSTAPKPPVTP